MRDSRGTHVGYQLLATYAMGDGTGLNRASDLIAKLRSGVAAAGLKEVAEVHHEFHPEGLTAVLILAQSHAIIHTWPEHSVVSVDLYACVDSARLALFEDVMTQEIGWPPLKREIREVRLPNVQTYGEGDSG